MSSTTEDSSDSRNLVTQHELMLRKREEQRAKTRARMAQFRRRLKQLPLDQQEAFKVRERDARQRYRTTHRPNTTRDRPYRNTFSEDYKLCQITMRLGGRRPNSQPKSTETQTGTATPAV